MSVNLIQLPPYMTCVCLFWPNSIILTSFFHSKLILSHLAVILFQEEGHIERLMCQHLIEFFDSFFNRMSIEWWKDVGMTCFQIQIKILGAKIEASYWSRAQNRGVSLVERTPGKKSKALTLIRNSLSFFPHLIIPMREWHWNDRMTWKWYKLIEQICRHTLEGGPLWSIEWYHNERMTLEW